jgi:hypothetical protein
MKKKWQISVGLKYKSQTAEALQKHASALGDFQRLWAKCPSVAAIDQRPKACHVISHSSQTSFLNQMPPGAKAALH